ncbi:hypothetical protein PSHT_07073 [Puccinia striiformis]|uniref:SET domain-containing protein n=1 Tax=Puccinia striiformis TaxID=27350 RepID=A0A2S4W118_9BASI|nr:hypothetical protein PSHT_07073 [Puccinia striiformis]
MNLGMAILQSILKLWLVSGALASVDFYGSFPPAGFQLSTLTSQISTSFLSLVQKFEGPSSEDEIASPFKSRTYVYDYKNPTARPIPSTAENPSRDGFTKQRCYPGSDPSEEEFCVFVNPTFGGDRGMVLYIRPSYFLEKLASFKIFKEDSALITETEREEYPYTLVHMPTKGGLGAVADRKLNIGELVIKDYSLVVITCDISEIDLDQWGIRLKYMVDLLPFKGRELFAKQHGVGEIDTAWIVSAFQRNVFASPQDNDESGGCAFAPEPAVNLNHDCRPNVAYKFNNETMQVEMRAMREIAPGEELTISCRTDSCDLKQTSNWCNPEKKRQKKLHGTYGFHCGCSLCSLSDAESDASDGRLDRIYELWETVADWYSSPPATPADAEEIIELFHTERMDVVFEEPYTMASLVYNSWGLTHEARKYAALAVAYGSHTHDKSGSKTRPICPSSTILKIIGPTT